METELDVKIVPKLWGNERWLVNNEKYCGKILTVKKDAMCSIHYHKIKDETFVLINGNITLEIFDDMVDLTPTRKYDMWPGMVIRLEPGTLHRFIGLAKISEIIEISTQHFDEDSYRLTPAKELHS